MQGQQFGRHFHSYYDDYILLPLFVFSGDQLLVSYLRPASLDAAHHAGAILALLVRRLRQAWPEVRIVLRGDSGFCRPLILNGCDRHDVDYIIGLAGNRRLAKLALDIDTRRPFASRRPVAPGLFDSEERGWRRAINLGIRSSTRIGGIQHPGLACGKG